MGLVDCAVLHNVTLTRSEVLIKSRWNKSFVSSQCEDVIWYIIFSLTKASALIYQQLAFGNLKKTHSAGYKPAERHTNPVS